MNKIEFSVRRYLESLSRGVVFRRRLPANLGGASVWVTPESRLRFWYPGLGSNDPWLLNMARQFIRPNDRVWDVGANVGLFAFAASYTAGQVLAVEPDAVLVNLLRRTARNLGDYTTLRSTLCKLQFQTIAESSGSVLLTGDGPLTISRAGVPRSREARGRRSRSQHFPLMPYLRPRSPQLF